MKEKVILAYSGGLDTTAIIPWLKENYGYDVICCCINCEQVKKEANVPCMEPQTGTHPSGAISMPMNALTKRDASFFSSGSP